jgi:phycocyanobilin:ferredoxin oxidoreductase
MSEVWNKLVTIQDFFIESFQNTGTEIYEPGMERFNHPGWLNRVWQSDTYRRAHIDVVDARNTKGLWMMHCCVFPHTDNDSPIFGFDVVAGKNKITGCFHDFSSIGNVTHPLIEWFGNEVGKHEWRKVRELPDWAKAIFTPHMIAAGNISKPDELEQIYTMATKHLTHYLNTVGETRFAVDNNTTNQNFYCENQKKNPHTPKVMTSLGLDDNDVKMFIQDCLFPEITQS